VGGVAIKFVYCWREPGALQSAAGRKRVARRPGKEGGRLEAARQATNILEGRANCAPT